MILVFYLSSIELLDTKNLIVATNTTPIVETTTKSLDFLEKFKEKDDGKNGNKIIECTIKNTQINCNWLKFEKQSNIIIYIFLDKLL